MEKSDKNPFLITASIIALLCAIGIILILKYHPFGLFSKEDTTDSLFEQDCGDLHNGSTHGDVIVTREDIQDTNNYQNNKILTYKYSGDGYTISFGVENVSATNGIFLNPHCSDSTIHVGYYIEPTTGVIQKSEEYASDMSYESHSDDKNFMIVDRTYDKLVSAEYHDETNYGIFWANQAFGEGEMNRGDTIRVRAVNIDTNRLLGIMLLTIEYKDDHFELAKVESADVYDTKELSEIARSDAIYAATDFLQSLTEIGTGAPNADYWSLFQEQAMVEKVEQPYFENLYNAEREPVHRGTFYNYDVYAVNMQVLGYGFVTVYLSPYTDTLGLPKSYIDEDDLCLTVIGYDAFHPESFASLDVDDSFWVRVSS